MRKKGEIWNHVIKYLETHLSPVEIETWFSGTSLQEIDSVTATIEVPNKFVAHWLKEKYAGKIRSGFSDLLGTAPEIQFVLPLNAVKDTSAIGSSPPKTRYTSGASLNKKLTFENFVTGEANRFAFQSALEAAKGSARHFNPLYIYGEPGRGKTHLLHAIGNYIKANRSREKAEYITADRFTSQVSSALRKRTMNQFKMDLEKASFLLFDDVHLLSGRLKTQKELISFFDAFHETSRQIVFTAEHPPNQIENFIEGMKSRLQWAVISRIDTPNQDIKLKIIDQKCREEGIHIPDDAAFFLANNTNNMKELVRLVTRLQTYASLHEKPIDISLVRLVTGGKRILSPAASVQQIQKITARFFDLSLADLLSKSKKRKYAYPRQLAMYLCRRYTDWSFKEIGIAFRKKDHSSVIYAVQHITRAREENDRIRKDILEIENLIA